MSWGEHAGTLSAEQQLSHQAHAPAEGRMATLLPRSNRSSKVPQAVFSPSVPPYPPADQAAAKDRLVHGPTGRQQVATLPSSSAVEYGLPVICPCNYSPVITGVITCNYSPPFPVTSNW